MVLCCFIPADESPEVLMYYICSTDEAWFKGTVELLGASGVYLELCIAGKGED